MTDRDQENGEPLSDEFEPGEDEFEEEPESPEDAVAEETSKPATEDGGRRRFGRRSAAEEPARPTGSVRGTHAERVHIDDRVSAVYALVAALALIVILVGSLVATHLPQGAAPSVAPLPSLSFQVPNATLTPSASTSASASASASTSASASASASAS